MTTMPDEPSGPIKEKLVRTKEQWARDGRALTGVMPPTVLLL